MSRVWGTILQWGSAIKVSIEFPVAPIHRRDMNEKLLKATLNPKKQQLIIYLAIFTLANNFLKWTYFGPTRFILPWTTLVHATLRVSDVIDKCNSWQIHRRNIRLIHITVTAVCKYKRWISVFWRFMEVCTQRVPGVTYFARDPLRSYFHEPQKNEIYFSSVFISSGGCFVLFHISLRCLQYLQLDPLSWNLPSYVSMDATWIMFFNCRIIIFSLYICT